MDPPVPIPNTVVKHPEAESTCLETGWEDRKLPVDRERVCVLQALFSFVIIQYGVLEHDSREKVSGFDADED